jgi:hypothetical protein
MTITIELSAEIETSLAALAAKQGMTLRIYLQHLLEQQVQTPDAISLPHVERARLWRESAEGLPHTAPLSDAAVSRENFYGTRG